MQTSQPLSADWQRVLASVKKALAQAVARLAEREQALANATPAAPTARPLDFSKFDERVIAFAASPQKAEQALNQLDSTLREEEEALRQWLTRAEAARRRLADGVGRAVG